MISLITIQVLLQVLKYGECGDTSQGPQPVPPNPGSFGGFSASPFRANISYSNFELESQEKTSSFQRSLEAALSPQGFSPTPPQLPG